MSLIQTLIGEGALVYWSHYKRYANDLTTTPATHTHSGTYFTGNGIKFGSISVADAAKLQGTDWTLVVYGRLQGSTAQGIMSKRDAGGTQYDWYISGSGQFSIYDGTDTRTLAATVEGARYSAISWNSGETPEGWTDGSSAGSYSGAVTVTADDAPLIIGNLYDGTRTNTGIFNGVMAVNRKLTSQEHSDLDAELQEIQRSFDTRPWAIPNGALWHQRKGVYESVANVTSGSLENSGFDVVSGSWRINHGIVKEEFRPLYKSIASGVAAIPTSRFHQTPSEAARGTFEACVKYTGTNTAYQMFISTAAAPFSNAAVSGYLLAVGTSIGIVRIFRVTNGTPVTIIGSANGEVSAGVEYHIKVTVGAGGVFTLYKNEELVSTVGGTGTNPVTDATHTISNFWTLEPDTGDEISGLVKRISVA